MKSDIEIAQEAVLWPIQKVAEHLDIPEDDLELYGKYKAKLSDEYLKSIEDRKDGKLIVITSHHREDIDAICNHIYCMEEGQLIAAN